jgi:hypothetical protein
VLVLVLETSKSSRSFVIDKVMPAIDLAWEPAILPVAAEDCRLPGDAITVACDK